MDPEAVVKKRDRPREEPKNVEEKAAKTAPIKIVELKKPLRLALYPNPVQESSSDEELLETDEELSETERPRPREEASSILKRPLPAEYLMTAKRNRGAKPKELPEIDPEEIKMYGDPANDEKEHPILNAESRKKVEEAVQSLETILERQNTGPGENSEIIKKFREMIILKPTGRKFGRLFRQIESKIFKSVEDFVIRCFDGEDFNERFQNYGSENVYIVNQTDETFGLEVPKLDFDNLSEYLGESVDREQSFAVSSYNKTHKDGTVSNFLNEIKKRDSGASNFDLLNLLSFEVSHESFTRDIKVPKFVHSRSIIDRLIEKYHEMKDRDDAEPDVLKRMEFMVQRFPMLEKFLLLTMRGSFTDLHVDPSATGVYYNVLKGKKIIFVTHATSENIKWYCDAELKGIREQVWIVAQHLEQFQRIELEEGQTLMLPPGWLHFVYTPEDSIVVGGNYLDEDHLELSCKMTKVEKKCVKGSIVKANLFPHFWETIYAYIEFFLIPELREAVENNTPVSRERFYYARFLNKELPRVYTGSVWMSKNQMRKNRTTLEDLIDTLKSKANFTAQIENNVESTDWFEVALSAARAAVDAVMEVRDERRIRRAAYTGRYPR